MATHIAASSDAPSRSHYDGVTIALHWATAVLVVAQFGMAEVWGWLQKGTPIRIGLITTHLAFGILLAAVIIIRICWRLAHRGRLPPAVSGLQHVLANAVHGILYLLLVAQATLGLLWGWSGGRSIPFFNLFSVPPLLSLDPDMRHTIGSLHENVAWAIIVVAFGHAVVAIGHHIVLRDNVLRRMLPGLAPRS
jgi:cytochrome b561